MRERYVTFNFVSDANDFSLFQTEKLGQRVILFVHFREVIFGFLKFITAEKNEMEVPKKILHIPKNSLINKWSVVKDVIQEVTSFEPEDTDYWGKAFKAMECVKLYTDSVTC